MWMFLLFELKLDDVNFIEYYFISESLSNFENFYVSRVSVFSSTVICLIFSDYVLNSNFCDLTQTFKVGHTVSHTVILYHVGAHVPLTCMLIGGFEG